MLSHTVFKQKIPMHSNNLPLTLISLNTWWALTRVSGSDSIQYLHNQFTCDIKNINENQYSFSAYCNPKGKMISNMYVFLFKNKEIGFIKPLSISQKIILTMKKYAIFSDVTITPDHNTALIGIAGKGSRKYLGLFFNRLPDQKNTMVHHRNVTLLYFNLPIERFLLIITNELLTNLLNQSSSLPIQYNNHYQWIALDIEAGYPYISLKTSELFLPQAANLDALQGISFNKGCYLGQEMIAKIQYRKLNKQSLYHLVNNINQNKYTQLPSSGDYIMIQINNQLWKNIGIVLQSCLIQKNKIWVQAILNKSMIPENHVYIQSKQLKNNLSTYTIIKK